ncbi:unnamed protein product [Prunus armeniaca]|uniref:DNA-directed RNA polymerase n=1 Tax=Prunus armeniaca TaxID=36596 RepID=A0A6J5WBE0_PRUAR|nr:unnamed protein product [Prunus armeniaca]
MAILRNVVICYDGTVRNVCSNSIIQFEYEVNTGSRHQHLFPAGEPVGVLAATAMSNPAYKAVLDSTPSSNSSWELMKCIHKGLLMLFLGGQLREKWIVFSGGEAEGSPMLKSAMSGKFGRVTVKLGTWALGKEKLGDPLGLWCEQNSPAGPPASAGLLPFGKVQGRALLGRFARFESYLYDSSHWQGSVTSCLGKAEYRPGFVTSVWVDLAITLRCRQGQKRLTSFVILARIWVLGSVQSTLVSSLAPFGKCPRECVYCAQPSLFGKGRLKGGGLGGGFGKVLNNRRLEAGLLNWSWGLALVPKLRHPSSRAVRKVSQEREVRPCGLGIAVIWTIGFFVSLVSSAHPLPFGKGGQVFGVRPLGFGRVEIRQLSGAGLLDFGQELRQVDRVLLGKTLRGPPVASPRCLPFNKAFSIPFSMSKSSGRESHDLLAFGEEDTESEEASLYVCSEDESSETEGVVEGVIESRMIVHEGEGGEPLVDFGSAAYKKMQRNYKVLEAIAD